MHIKDQCSYAERAGKYLKTQLARGRREAIGEARKGYRDNFAEKIGVDPRTLSRYCIAIHDVDTIASIASALGVSIGDMLSYDGEDVPFSCKKGQNVSVNYLSIVDKIFL